MTISSQISTNPSPPKNNDNREKTTTNKTTTTRKKKEKKKKLFGCRRHSVIVLLSLTIFYFTNHDFVCVALSDALSKVYAIIFDCGLL